jgi:hypothetical protein
MPTFVPLYSSKGNVGYVNADAIVLFNPCGKHIIALINDEQAACVCSYDSFNDFVKKLGITPPAGKCPWTTGVKEDPACKI